MNHPNGNEQPLRQSASEDAVANTSRGTNTSNKKKKRQRQVEDDAATQLPVATNNALLARQQLENEQHYQLLLSLQQQQQQQQMLQTLMVSNTNNNNTTNGNNSLRGAAASLAWDNSTATTPSSAMLLMHHAQRMQQQQHAATNQNMQQQQQQHRGLTDGPFAQQVQGAHRAHHHFDQDESAVILPPGFLPQPFAPPEEVTPMMNPSVLWILQQQEQARRANMLMQAAFAGTSYSGLDTAPSNAITAITPRGILESPRDGRSVDLYMKTDDDILSDHQILIRKQIEVSFGYTKNVFWSKHTFVPPHPYEHYRFFIKSSLKLGMLIFQPLLMVVEKKYSMVKLEFVANTAAPCLQIIEPRGVSFIQPHDVPFTKQHKIWWHLILLLLAQKFQKN